MAPIVPVAISHWARGIIDDVAFMTSNMAEELNTYDMCAVLRYEYPHQRYINPGDVTTIQEWLDAKGGYGGLKEGVKHAIAILGEDKATRWREGAERSLHMSKQMRWDAYDMFEEEDPRGEIEEVAEQLSGLAVDRENAPGGVEMRGMREEEDEDEPTRAVEPQRVEGGWKILSKSDQRHEDVQGILREVKASAPSPEAGEGEASDQKAAKK